MQRAELLVRMAREIDAIRRPHPVRVAIDGPSTAGKTTLADDLAGIVTRPCVRTSLDDFHRPGHKFRSMRGEWTPSLYETEGYDWQAFRDVLLDPLGPGGSGRVRPGLFDSYRDEPIPAEWVTVAADGCVIVDGMYLLGEAWAGLFDYRIWLDVSPATVVSRACARDVAWVGSVDAVRERYEGFWVPAHAAYQAEHAPRSRADVLIDNEDFANPRILTR